MASQLSPYQACTLGAWLRSARKSKGLIVRKVAAEADVDPSHLNKVERDDRLPTAESLGRIAAAYGVELSELRRRYLARKFMIECGDDPALAAEAAAQLREDVAAYVVNTPVNNLSVQALSPPPEGRV